MGALSPSQRRRLEPRDVVTTVGLSLIPVAGVVFLDWHVGTILVLYWLENAIAGVFALIRIGAAEGTPDPDTTDPFAKPEVTKTGLQIWLVLHYGLFWAFSSQLVFGVAPGIIGYDGAPFGGEPVGLALALVAVGAVRWREYRRFIDSGEYRVATPVSQMWAPYPRAAILQAGIMIGAFLASALPGITGPVAIVVGKAAYELLWELRIGPFGTFDALMDGASRRGRAPDPADAAVAADTESG